MKYKDWDLVEEKKIKISQNKTEVQRIISIKQKRIYHKERGVGQTAVKINPWLVEVKKIPKMNENQPKITAYKREAND